jgi:hypothetical protein
MEEFVCVFLHDGSPFPASRADMCLKPQCAAP